MRIIINIVFVIMITIIIIIVTVIIIVIIIIKNIRDGFSNSSSPEWQREIQDNLQWHFPVLLTSTAYLKKVEKYFYDAFRRKLNVKGYVSISWNMIYKTLPLQKYDQRR